MRTVPPRVLVRGEKRRSLMLALKWRGLSRPSLKEIDSELLLDDMVARRSGETMLMDSPALQAMRTWWRAGNSRTHALVYVGEVGEGKTVAMARAVLAWPVARGSATLPVFCSEADLIASINHTERNRTRKNEPVRAPVSPALAKRAAAAPLLAIDEVGMGDAWAREIEAYQRFLARRHTRLGFYTMVSANPRGDLEPASVIEQRVGAHVWDRWKDQGWPLARLGDVPRRLRQHREIRAALARYREELLSAYEEPGQKPLSPERVEELRGIIAGLTARTATEGTPCQQ